MERIIFFLVAFRATLAVEYIVTTVTSSEYSNSGTDDILYCTILGTEGKTAEYRMSNPGNDREVGQTDTYNITDNTEIGEFRCVSIRVTGTDGWAFAEISVEVDGTPSLALYKGFGWLDDDPVEVREIAFCITDFIDKTDNRCPKSHPFSYLLNNWCCSDDQERTLF
ncbi:hypothetical protein ACHWQZ_G005721 [Mnemiopsis leidyi]